MDLDITTCYEFIKEVVNTSETIEEGMIRLATYCQKRSPDMIWSKFQELDFQAEVFRLEKWLERLLIEETPSDSIIAYYFGIYNPKDMFEILIF